MYSINATNLISSTDREKVLQFFEPFPELISFLKRQRCLEEFLDYVYDRYGGDANGQEWIYELISGKSKGILTEILTWKNTPSGWSFWMMKHNQFKDSRKRKEPKIRKPYKVVRK